MSRIDEMGPEARLLYDMKIDALDIKVERASVQEGRTFSAEAMHDLSNTFNTFVMARLLARWDRLGEPPTALTVHVTLDIG